MLTRFKMNVQRYPRLFVLWMAGWVIAVAESLIPRLVGIDQTHLMYAGALDLALAFVLSGLTYLWITRNAERTAILTDILDRFEGREVCTISEHTDETDEDYDEYDEEFDEETNDEEPEPEEEDDLNGIS